MNPFKIVNLGETGLILKLVRNGGVVGFPDGNPTTFQQNTIATGFCVSPDIHSEYVEDLSQAVVMRTIPMGVSGVVTITSDGVKKTYRYNNLNSFDAKINWLNSIGNKAIKCQVVEGNRVQITIGDGSREMIIRFIDQDVNYIDNKLTPLEGSSIVGENHLYLGLSAIPTDILLVRTDGSEERLMVGGTATIEKMFPGLSDEEIAVAVYDVATLRFNKTVTGIEGSMLALQHIPELVVDIVGPIGEDTFTNCNFQALSLGNSVTTIGANAFANNSACTDLNIPDNITAIGANAFSGWTVGSRLTIGKGITKLVDGQFTGWAGPKTSLALSEGIKEIGPNAFTNWNCESLILPNTLAKIGAGAFSGWIDCEVLRIGSGTVEIAERAFTLWGSCSELDLGGTTYIGASAFENWSSYTTGLTIPSSVRYIGNHAFANWTNATSLTFDEGIVNIGDGTEANVEQFMNWSSATSLTLPNTLVNTNRSFTGWTSCSKLSLGRAMTELGGGEFTDLGFMAENHADIVIPNTVTEIDGAFLGAVVNTFTIGSGVTHVGELDIDIDKALYLLPTTPPTTDGSDLLPRTSDKLIVYCADVQAYTTADGWSKYAVAGDNDRTTLYAELP